VTSKIRKIATFYRVSAVVVLMRAYELQKLDYQTFSEMMDAEYARFQKQEQPKNEQEETTGNFWASFNARNGRRLTNSVVASVREGRVLYTEAASLLGVKVKTLNKFLQKHGGE
jgi:Zn-dependent peptidase ImmA (M78 family)